MSRVLVDIGGTKTLVALEQAGTVVDCRRIPTPRDRAADVTDMVVGAAQALLAEHPDTELAAIAIAVAGSVNAHTGVVRRANNLPFDDYPLKRRIHEVFDVPVLVEEDANAGAAGEAAAGSGRGHSVVAYVTLSSGIGMGIVVDGVLFRGATFDAGELGHVVVDPLAETTCACQRQGCLEALASGLALEREGRELAVGAAGSDVAAGSDALTAREMLRAAEDEGSRFAPLVASAAGWTARGLDTVTHILDPSVIVLGGGLMNSDFYYASIVRSYRALNPASFRAEAVELVRASLSPWSVIAGMYELSVPGDGGLQIAPSLDLVTPASERW
jgi:glucokinase